MNIEDAHSLPAEIEKLAEGFEARDFHFAVVCANKVLNLLVPEQPHEDEALSTGWLAESHKSLKALDSKDFGLAAMCLRKAVKAYTGNPAIVGATAEDVKAVRHYFEEIAISALSFKDDRTAIRSPADPRHLFAIYFQDLLSGDAVI